MKKVVVIGGGIAGMQTALTLKEYGIEPVIVEKDSRLGGKLNLWDRLFPTKTPADEVLGPYLEAVKAAGIEVKFGAEVAAVSKDGKSVTLGSGEVVSGDAVVIASGFDLFDASLKEELGYGIYDNVITSAELEGMFKENRVLTTKGEKPRRVALLHCVGSRDEKVKQNHCSRVCCITGVKQAMEIKELYPECEVFNFYMDMRMFGPGYEEIYRESQEDYGVNHIRGRISEAGPTIDGRLQIKTEDTLVGRPMKMDVDMLVLLIGMCSAKSNGALAESAGISLRKSEFFAPTDSFINNTLSGNANVFFAGTATAPKNVGETINESIAAAHNVAKHLNVII